MAASKLPVLLRRGLSDGRSAWATSSGHTFRLSRVSPELPQTPSRMPVGSAARKQALQGPARVTATLVNKSLIVSWSTLDHNQPITMPFVPFPIAKRRCQRNSKFFPNRPIILQALNHEDSSVCADFNNSLHRIRKTTRGDVPHVEWVQKSPIGETSSNMFLIINEEQPNHCQFHGQGHESNLFDPIRDDEDSIFEIEINDLPSCKDSSHKKHSFRAKFKYSFFGASWRQHITSVCRDANAIKRREYRAWIGAKGLHLS